MNSRTVRSFAFVVSAFGLLAATACSSSPQSSASSSPLAPSEQAGRVGGAANTVTMQGLVSNLSGKCANVKFILGAAKVETSAKTTYPSGSCQTLVFAQRVDVTGSLNGNTLTASSITQLKNKDGL